MSALNQCTDACVVLLHEHFRPTHVEHVTEQMKALGAPTLRGKWHDGRWYLSEG